MKKLIVAVILSLMIGLPALATTEQPTCDTGFHYVGEYKTVTTSHFECTKRVWGFCVQWKEVFTTTGSWVGSCVADEVIPEPEPEVVPEVKPIVNSSWIINIPRVSDDNFYTVISGNNVSVFYLASHKSVGNVIVTDKKGQQEVFTQNGEYTFHEVKMTLKAGTYKIQPMYSYNFQTVYGKIKTIVIE